MKKYYCNQYSLPPLGCCFLLFFLSSSSLFLFGSCGGQEQGGEHDDGDGVVSAPSMAPMERREQEALYSAIQGFVGEWWNGSDLYPDPCGWTPIQGVTCNLYDGLWYVSALNIGPVYDNSLQCAPDSKFTHHLFDLQHLAALSIYDCFSLSPNHRQNQAAVTLSGLSWENFANTLEALEFRSNPGLTGSIQSSIGTLRQLQSLVILENGLSGPLPVEMANLVSLKRLVVSANGFSGRIPSGLGNLKSLLIFDSSRNNLSGPLPLTFGGLTSLLKLDMSNNKLGGSLPREIGNLRNLTLLDLGSNNFSGGLVQSIQGMLSLKEMVMSNNPLGGDLMAIQWQNLQDLEALDLSNTALTGNIPEPLTQLKKLRFLGLSRNSISGTPPKELASLPCISALYLNENNLTGQLEFPEAFLVRIGRRFGAWDNPDLCYRAPAPTTSSAIHVPFGVKPCPQESGGVISSVHVGSLANMSERAGGDGDDLYWNSQRVTSLGTTKRWNHLNGVWWWSVVLCLVLVVFL